jgi:hypothetical protein
MQRAKAFFFVCAGVFLLALAYHLGATTAKAQGPGNPIAGVAALYTGGGYTTPVVVMSNGDLYTTPAAYGAAPPFVLKGNIFTSATPAAQQTWGQLKAQYRK